MFELSMTVLWLACFIIAAVPSVGIWFYCKVVLKVPGLKTLIDASPFH